VRPLLTLIVLLPLAGFLLNGIAGNRLGKRFVSVVGCGLPVLAFAAVVKCLIDLTAGAPSLEFILELLEQLALAGSVCLSADSCVSPSEGKVHFGTRGRKTRSLFKLLDRSLYLPKVEQDAAEDVPGGKHVGRKLHGLLREWQRRVQFVTLQVLEGHLHHRRLV